MIPDSRLLPGSPGSGTRSLHGPQTTATIRFDDLLMVHEVIEYIVNQTDKGTLQKFASILEISTGEMQSLLNRLWDARGTLCKPSSE